MEKLIQESLGEGNVHAEELDISFYLSEEQIQEHRSKEICRCYEEMDPLLEEVNEEESLKLRIYGEVKRTNRTEAYEDVEREKVYEENIYRGHLKSLLKNRFLRVNKHNADYVFMIEKFVNGTKYNKEKEEKRKEH
jgi:predicted glycoside hydrolase/deacetylase ChbG (UPF0249 family)